MKRTREVEPTVEPAATAWASQQRGKYFNRGSLSLLPILEKIERQPAEPNCLPVARVIRATSTEPRRVLICHYVFRRRCHVTVEGQFKALASSKSVYWDRFKGRVPSQSA